MAFGHASLSALRAHCAWRPCARWLLLVTFVALRGLPSPRPRFAAECSEGWRSFRFAFCGRKCYGYSMGYHIRLVAAESNLRALNAESSLTLQYAAIFATLR